MQRIAEVSDTVTAKLPVYQRNVPKTDEMTFQQKIDTLLPSDLHNLENPGTYLEQRRKQASVKKENMEKMLIDPLLKEYRDKVFPIFEKDPEYQPKNQWEMSLSEHRLYSNKILSGLVKAIGYTPEDFEKNKDYLIYMMLVSGGLNTSAATKFAVHFGLYIGTLLKLGSQKHLKYAHRAMELKDLGSFALTELGHGSNVQSILTTATYHHNERSFILNTPHELGMKYWIGNLAKTCNYTVVFANLILGDQNYGVHVFHVQIRDDKGNLMPGVQVGDIGHKLGMNGVDNGWAVFRRVKLPYDALLDKFSQIDENGNFISEVKKKTERFALQLAALSSGRLIVSLTSSFATNMAGIITTRYLAVRKQFGAKKYQEETLITYPLVQSRLFPALSLSTIYFIYTETLMKQFVRTDVSKVGDKSVKELHAIASVMKCISSWHALESFNVFRELCGGQGFSSDSLLPSIITDHNVQVTWEGTNDVLIQQTAKFILTTFSKYMQKGEIEYKSFEFLREFEDDQKTAKMAEEIHEFVAGFSAKGFDMDRLISDLKRVLQLRIKVASEVVAERFAMSMEVIKDMFHAYNRTLPHAVMDACIFFGDYKAFEHFEEKIIIFSADKTLANEVLFFKRMLINAMISRLKLHTHYLSGKFGVKFFTAMDEISLEINNQMVDDMIIYTDTISPPDWVMNSTLGKSDGDIYRNIIAKLYSNPENFGKSEHWSEIMRIRGSK